MPPLDLHLRGPRADLVGSTPSPERSLLDRMNDLESKFKEAMHSLSQAIGELEGKIADLERKVG